MKSNKQRTIEGIELLIKERYTKGGMLVICPLCLIHNNGQNIKCSGCPNQVFRQNEMYMTAPCTISKTFKQWQINYIPRKRFWQAALPELKELPNKAFTKSGYKDEYFNFLIAIDEITFIISHNHEKV